MNLRILLKKTSKIFTNGVTDLIVVYLSAVHESPAKFAETDYILGNVHTLISSQTSDYVSVYTALAYDNPDFNFDFGSRQTVAKRFILQSNSSSNNSNTSVPIFRQYFGGWFWELFVCMLIMIPLLVIGTYSIDSIQTPIFESKKKTN